MRHIFFPHEAVTYEEDRDQTRRMYLRSAGPTPPRIVVPKNISNKRHSPTPYPVHNTEPQTFKLGITLQELDGSCLDFKSMPTHLFRFIDVKALVEEKTLVIIDFQPPDLWPYRFRDFMPWGRERHEMMTYFLLFYPSVGIAPILGPQHQRSPRFRLLTPCEKDGGSSIDIGLILHLLTHFDSTEMPQFLWVSQFCLFHSHVPVIQPGLSVLFEHAVACLMLPEVPSVRVTGSMRSDALIANRTFRSRMENVHSQVVQYLIKEYPEEFYSKDNKHRSATFPPSTSRLDALFRTTYDQRYDLFRPIHDPSQRYASTYQFAMSKNIIHPLACLEYYYATHQFAPPMLDDEDDLGNHWRVSYYISGVRGIYVK